MKVGEEIFETRACGRLRKEKIVPMIGDRVALSENCDLVTEILPRKSSFIRPPVANVDQMVIVASPISPQIDLLLVDTLILQNEISGIDTVLCLNKTDLVDESTVEQIADIYKNAGYKTIFASALNNRGGEQLKTVLKGKITAFAGNSGVGKSSILNLLNKDFGLETGSISRIERGRHTTRHVELLPLEDDTFVVDTPGFSRLEIPTLCAEDISAYFKDFALYSKDCKFRGCTHIDEPGCAVKIALENGTIGASRYTNYKYFYGKLKDIKKWQL